MRRKIKNIKNIKDTDKFQVLVLGGYHHKLDEGIKMMCNYLNFELHFNKNIKNPDLIMCPQYRQIKNFKKVIYGNQFGVFPTNQAKSLDHGVYIQPSEWVAENVWGDLKNIPLKVFPFPVNTGKFKPSDSKKEREKIIFYFKHRHPDDYNFMLEKFKEKDIEPIIFSYDKRYSEEDYLKTLQNTKYMIVLAGHESQGFGLQEAMSCDVPLLIWNVKSMNQEYGQNYNDISATTVPYWDENCGELFYTKEEFDETFEKFINNLDSYKPRNFILNNLSVEKCSEIFTNIINDL
jgi:hypothetical protein